MENEKEIRICEECGAIIEENESYEEFNGKFYHEDCFNENFVHCFNCGKYERLNDAVWVESESDYVCDRCYNNDFVTCHGCGEVVRYDESYRTEDSEEYFCRYCRDESLYYCEGCGEFFEYSSSGDWDGDYWYCDDCYVGNGVIKGYHDFKSSNNFHFCGKESRLEAPHIGFELEIDGDRYGEKTELAETIVSEWGDFFHLEEDGSLNCGFEIISQPTTVSYMEENRENMRSTFHDIVRHGFTSHNNGNCGLHMHIDKDYFGKSTELAIAKLLLIFERHWENLLKFSRRTESQTHWCEHNGKITETLDNAKKYYSGSYSDSQKDMLTENNVKYEEDRYGRVTFNSYNDFKKAKEILGKKGYIVSSSINMGRYFAVNLNNTNTIEIRLWRGSVREETFFATLKFTARLAQLAKSKTIMEIDRMTWEEILGGDAEILSYWETVKNR